LSGVAAGSRLTKFNSTVRSFTPRGHCVTRFWARSRSMVVDTSAAVLGHARQRSGSPFRPAPLRHAPSRLNRHEDVYRVVSQGGERF
jgi:hypothetical protein